MSRRAFLGGAAATAFTAMFASTIERAGAVPAHHVSGDITDVEHVVILMMENRSFDHYFGTLRGVRGFGDRFPVPLASGKPIWFEADSSGEVVPFHLDTETTSAMRVPDTPHNWSDAHAAWDSGRFGRWVEAKTFHSMGYYGRDDIPFQTALAEAFTLCDHHHCSLQTGTHPNRTVFMTGTNVAPGRTTPATDQTQALIDNQNKRGAKYGRYTWTTYPERLEKAGVSWQIYQDPVDNWDGLLAPWESFAKYHDVRADDALYQKALRKRTVDDLRDAVLAGTLPSVSWVVPSRRWSEHPAESSPIQGAGYTQRVLDALTANPEVWSKTALIVTFDENDGFFDHVPPPAVPSYDDNGELAGATTLSTSLAGEYHRETVGGKTVTRPYGMGARVPMYIVSPFSRGGWVCSEVFDHTSTIQFLERRFGVHEPNITPWHRAVAGDLTSAFDFATPNATVPTLPDMRDVTSATMVVDDKPPVTRPAHGQLPKQPAGVRPSRALPYDLHADATVDLALKRLAIKFRNTGSAGAVFHVYDQLHLTRIPRRYTVEAGKQLSGVWDLAADSGRYDLWILGPAGWFRQVCGDTRLASTVPEVSLVPREGNAIELTLTNSSRHDCVITVTDQTYGDVPPTHITVGAGQSEIRTWILYRGQNWYDLDVTAAPGQGFLRRFAGRVENRAAATSDPAVGVVAARTTALVGPKPSETNGSHATGTSAAGPVMRTSAGAGLDPSSIYEW